MWPEAGAGFEASPYSPAGFAQARWRLLRAKRNLTNRERNKATLAGALIVGGVLLAAVIGLVLHLVG